MLPNPSNSLINAEPPLSLQCVAVSKRATTTKWSRTYTRVSGLDSTCFHLASFRLEIFPHRLYYTCVLHWPFWPIYEPNRNRWKWGTLSWRQSPDHEERPQIRIEGLWLSWEGKSQLIQPWTKESHRHWQGGQYLKDLISQPTFCWIVIKRKTAKLSTVFFPWHWAPAVVEMLRGQELEPKRHPGYIREVLAF